MEGNEKKKKNDYINPEKTLHGFIRNGKLWKAELLAADPNCNVNLVGGFLDNYTPLMHASFFGYFDLVKTLLRRQDLLINYQTNQGYSALIVASDGRDPNGIELLIDDPRTDVNLVDNNGRSALWWAYKNSNIPFMKLLISHGANVKGVAESVIKIVKEYESKPLSAEATEVMKNCKLYLPEFTRVAKTNKYYPTEFKEWAFNFILCCLRSRSFPKDIIYLLLEYIARAWKR